METILISASDPQAYSLALRTLQRGGLIAFPTDTVYGLAVPAFSREGIDQLFSAKGRETAKAIAVLIAGMEQLDQVANLICADALRLAEKFWPGPLTLVAPRHPSLPDSLAPLPTVGVRVPDHAVALELLRRSGPLATTSANLSGQPNPLTAQDVLNQLGGRIDLILDGGATPGGVPSTVVDCTQGELAILRQGPITWQDIRQVLE